MKKTILAILFLIGICLVQGQIDASIELSAINDVLPDVLQQERTSNPYIDCYIPDTSKYEEESADEFNFGFSRIELDTLKFRLFINDTLLSLDEIIAKNKWLYKDNLFESIYSELIHQKSFKGLDEILFDTELIKNTWNYSKTTSLSQTLEDGVFLVKLNFSRVCFNKERSLGFFYLEVLDSWDNGYVSLILIAKKKYNNRWNLIDGTYYR